jgi:long-chain fatty acid transport protein
MKKGKLLISLVTFLVFLSSMALANGLNLNGLGARAVAMGGAFVGLADDFSAVYWNPAGAAQFGKKYFGFSGFAILPSMSYTFDMAMVDATAPSKVYPGGMAAYYHPISDKLTAGISVYSPSGLGMKWDSADFANISGPPNFAPNPNIKWESFVFMVTASPTVAYKISDQVSLGAALNVSYASVDLAMYAGSAQPYPGVYVNLGQQEIKMSGWGLGATIGVLVTPSEYFSVGATFKTPSKFSLSGDAEISGFPQLRMEDMSGIETEITWPMWFAVGVAVRPIDGLVLTFDVQYTDWKQIDVLELSFEDPFWDATMALSGENEMDMFWESKTQFRVGAEYKVSDSFALRGGYYYDPTPSPDKTLNVLLPSATFNGFCGGFGYNTNGLALDFTVEYLTGKNRDVPFLKTIKDPDWESAMPGVYEMSVLTFEFSVGYKW